MSIAEAFELLKLLMETQRLDQLDHLYLRPRVVLAQQNSFLRECLSVLFAHFILDFQVLFRILLSLLVEDLLIQLQPLFSFE